MVDSTVRWLFAAVVRDDGVALLKYTEGTAGGGDVEACKHCKRQQVATRFQSAGEAAYGDQGKSPGDEQ